MDIQELMKKQKDLKVEIDQCTTEEGEVISDENVMQLVSFTLDKVEYGVDILNVHEILRMQDITNLPNTPQFIRGVINLRGNVIPVVDVRRRFGFPDTDFTELTRIVVVQTGEKQVGLLVDNVYQVVRLYESHIDEPSDLLEGVSQEFIHGIGRLKDRLIVILNLTNMLFSEEELKSDSADKISIM